MTPAEKASREKPQYKTNGRSRKIVWQCRVREFREQLGLSLRDIEKATGISNVTVLEIERGCETTLSNALALACFFGKKIHDLWIRRV